MRGRGCPSLELRTRAMGHSSREHTRGAHGVSHVAGLLAGPESDFFAELAVNAILSVKTESTSEVASSKKSTKYPVR